MERDLREVIGNSLILNSPFLFLNLNISSDETYNMLSIFLQTIKFDCLFSAIFQSF